MPAFSSTLAGSRILVTGAGGFIGSHLVRRLLQLHAEVTGLSRRSGQLAAEVAHGLPFISCDLRSLQQTRAAMQQVRPDVIVHLAGQPDRSESAAQTASVLEHNLRGLSHVLEALRDWPGCTLIYGDSVKVYGNGGVPYRGDQAVQPLSSYAVTKAAGTQLIEVYRRVHGLRATSLRPTLIYGPGQPFNLFTYLFESIRSGKSEIVVEGGAQTRDPLYIDDAVDAFTRACAAGPALDGHILPLGGGHEISVRELALLAVELLGGKQTVRCSLSTIRPNETQRSWCDNREMAQALGWQPWTTLEDGIRRTAGAVDSVAATANGPLIHTVRTSDVTG